LTPPLGHRGRVNHIAFGPEHLVVTAGSDGTARVWDSRTGELVSPPLRHGRAVLWSAFAPDGGLLATASADGTVRLWDCSPDGRDEGELLRLSELLANRRLDADGGLVTLEAERLKQLATMRSRP
jgi:WD40 repeat protein